ncbi:MAG: hypothetical protein M3O78_07695 [Chloroflexota bacterium]|nr:hypothetical protein [Chloroflexota bacterium]
MSIDHTLSWEVARVGGLVAYLLTTASVLLGLVLSLRTHSSRWPSFITNELHRHVTALSLVFIGVHTLAVWVDPFTGFSPAEVLVPMATHYRALWIALGIVSAYLAAAIWLSEYIRHWIGYAWWHRLHLLAFAVFLLATLHGLGSGSDSSAWWALALYGGAVGVVAILAVARASRVPWGPSRRALALGISLLVLALVVFSVRGPLQPGWNAFANNGHGSGASQAWLASHPAPSGPPAAFGTDLELSIVGSDLLDARFGGAASGELQMLLNQSSSLIAMLFADGWSCQGSLTMSDATTVVSRCVGGDGVGLAVQVSELRQVGEQVLGHLQVSQG